MVKECRSFMGMVNFVSIFCLKFQGLLKPINELTRKGRHFIWGDEQQKAFEEKRIDYKDPLSYIYQIGKDDSNYIQILANLPLVVHCIKSKMVNPG